MDFLRYKRLVIEARNKAGFDSLPEDQFAGIYGQYCNTQFDFPDRALQKVSGGWLLLDGEILEEKNEVVFIDRGFEYYAAKKYIQLLENAESRGKEFNLTIADVKRLLRVKRCFYTGVELTARGAIHKDTDRTVDRRDPSKGYVKGNVVACCLAANKFKETIEHQLDSVVDKKKQIKVIKKMFDFQ